ncbi:MAG: hypothetical protein A3C84_03215 [Candidatus Ryanbacteria bacterium RIFCSPHIGHO2_02_FULL_48_12]|uniref:Nudix hydrolase domain-containing protein n=1 Tax=Candidatus Ryanbacteria bacterium RIFCSPHIGHO2_01_FULL_48_27 TaxID=1802115 RepID=A0A1G2G780_9BACT|nr:MAG: hypothetical protein A2756_05820 [Candidatus Ryanbacteria bacterium RIFCSPHIGHO2_01_FULL_48_27]OGZ50222.1 MAG: hypothetical protein A3C84_03215 [Candidatus Ryanbacteria bacterium RIFCSPHIGHO2_02_FULL_48_12]
MEDASKHFVGKIAQKAIIEKDGKVLVCRGIGDSVWEFPGGRLHMDESPQEGLRREIFEELNISVAVNGPIHICRSLHTKSSTWRVLVAYHCALEEGQTLTIDPEEVEDAKWVSHEELKTLPMFDDCREVADVFLKNLP